MKREEIDRLARAIAGELVRRGWVPAPVRPDPPGGPTPGQLPAWAGAAQRLADVAPGGEESPISRRAALGPLAAAARGAAAGRGPSPLVGGVAGQSGRRATARSVPVAVSNRHVHISADHFRQLFGIAEPTRERDISQPGQFAAREKVTVVGPEGEIEDVRIVGPPRGVTQVELAASDCRRIGLDAPVRDSGRVGGSAPVTLRGPAGSLSLNEGAVIAARHLHLSPEESMRLGLSDGERVDVVVGEPPRTTLLQGVLVRAGPTHATELHVDVDEANALGLRTGARALVGRARSGRSDRDGKRGRRLLTERDVARVAASGGQVSDVEYLLTPAARDRARALGILNERSQ